MSRIGQEPLVFDPFTIHRQCCNTCATFFKKILPVCSFAFIRLQKGAKG